MRGRLLPILAACVLSVLGVTAGSASAAMVTVFGHNGRTHVVNNRFLSGPGTSPYLPSAPVTWPLLQPVGDPLTITPSTSAPFARIARIGRVASASTTTSTTGSATTTTKTTPTKTKKKSTDPQAFPNALAALRKAGQISTVLYQADLQTWNSAISEQKHIAKWRATQVGTVTTLLHDLAVRRQVTSARLPILMLTLQNNAQYWKTGKALAYPDRVQFQGSELVWEYYPGYGLQFQPQGTFGEADAYYTYGKAPYTQLQQVMAELLPLAVKRAGGIAWEYYFNWEGGQPPWVSAMAQATGIEALTNAYLATGNHAFLNDAHKALPLLQTKPPTGVAVKTSLGTRYLQYSFTPGTDIINAFLQTLLGLYDYAQASNDPTALSLYNAGNRQAQSELQSFVVGGWSLYQPGEADNLNYHELVTGFLQLLCQKTTIPVYCTTYQKFEGDLLSRPQLTLDTLSAAANKKFSLQFDVSKYASVGVTLSQGSKNLIYTKKSFYAGTRSFPAPKLKVGTYPLTMSVTDLNGHYAKLSTSFRVCKGGCPPVADAGKPTTGAVPTVTVPLPKPTTTKTTTTTTPTKTTTTKTGTTTVPTTPPGGGAVPPTPTTPTTPTTTAPTTTTDTTTTPPTGGSGLPPN
jgi:D-glucuronyl C5-epimerase C-terminus